MKRKFDLGTVIVLMMLVATVTWLVAQWQTTERYNSQIERTMRQSKEFEKVKQAKDYIESVFIGSWDEEKLLDGAVRGMMESLDDKWSGYLSAEDFQNRKASSNNKSVGIGVSAFPDEETGGILVVDVHGDSPAFEAGIMAQDLIIGVDGESIIDMEYILAVDAIRGEANTPVMIEIYRPSVNREITFEMIRREYTVESVRSRILEGNVGYIRVRNFDKGTEIAFVEAIANLRLADVRGIIFDMRNNPGGSKEVMLMMLDQIIPEGRVMFQSRRKGTDMRQDISGEGSIDLPMMVIINGNSYSAAEFFAAALREYGFAELVGEPTTGKGLMQIEIELLDGSGIFLSAGEYFTPRGVSLADTEGLRPDYFIKFSDEEAARFFTFEPGEDRQIIRAYNELLRKIEIFEAREASGDAGAD
jgi:carboxyl-terminal processing protease